jgi:tRNA uridine 5-carboxymethylaminomethyl modification enzyme
LSASPTVLARAGFAVNQDGVARSAWDLLGYPDMTLARLAAVWPQVAGIDDATALQLEIEGKYRGYLSRQEAEIGAYRRDEDMELPAGLDYAAIGSLSTEVRQKLAAARPASLAAAARITGVTPAAISALLGHVKRRGAA